MTRRTALLIAALLLASAAIAFVGLIVGAKPMSLEAALRAIVSPNQGTDGIIVWTLRLPRSIAAFVTGAGLAVSGMLLQSATRNPLAAPDLTGAIGGAVAVIVFFFIFVPSLSSLFYPPIGFLGALLASGVTLWVARGGSASPLHLALGGVTVSLFLAGITTYILLRGGPMSPSVYFWLSGGLQGRSWTHVLFMLPWVAAGIGGALLASRAIALLSLGDDTAAAMGLRLGPFKLLLLVLAILPVAGVTPVSGPIAFIGLCVPHVVRLLRIKGTAEQILANLALGGFVLLFADVLARTLAAPRELPVGILTALVGGPVFIYLAQRRGGLLGATA